MMFPADDSNIVNIRPASDGALLGPLAFKVYCRLCVGLPREAGPYSTAVEANLNAQRHRTEHLVALANEIKDGAR